MESITLLISRAPAEPLEDQVPSGKQIGDPPAVYIGNEGNIRIT